MASSSALNGGTARTRPSVKIEEVVNDALAPVEEAEKVAAGRYVDTELFVGIARTFCW